MSNPMKGEATLRVGEAEHRLVINWGVLIQVERECGLPLLLPNLWQHLGFLIALLRFSLVAGGGKMLTDEQAATMLAEADDALGVLNGAYLAIMPQTADDQGSTGGNVQSPQNGTGMRSSPTGAKRGARRPHSG